MYPSSCLAHSNLLQHELVKRLFLVIKLPWHICYQKTPNWSYGDRSISGPSISIDLFVSLYTKWYCLDYCSVKTRKCEPPIVFFFNVVLLPFNVLQRGHGNMELEDVYSGVKSFWYHVYFFVIFYIFHELLEDFFIKMLESAYPLDYCFETFQLISDYFFFLQVQFCCIT